ncbi:hypothetical protein C0J27_05455 [Candidatus Chromulinivorax destructor]|uniref:Uncharacterized protein n=2 Tax=Candidatus Chromulinivorax destructor TaxID=2066483 RepID=A0A345ZCY1_9BACT|nr:hypothetical protein C0J27_05455 [Candidatus Chromulinivorax destructor]
MKKILLLVLIASHTHNIMPMLSAYVCCYSFGYPRPSGVSCCEVHCCCVGCEYWCPNQIPAVNNTDNDSISDISSCQDLEDITIDGIDAPHIGMSQERAYNGVVCVQPDAPASTSLTNNTTVGNRDTFLSEKVTQSMVVHSYSVAKSKSSSYNYSYHSESIETSNSYSKRTVEQVSTPYENTERRSAVVFVNEPDQQNRLGLQHYNSASGAPIIHKID